jgi:hypothetical protein
MVPDESVVMMSVAFLIVMMSVNKLNVIMLNVVTVSIVAPFKQLMIFISALAIFNFSFEH